MTITDPVFYDSDQLNLPHIPFIIQLPDMCFKVYFPLCTAAQREYLPHFDLISIRQKNIGYRGMGFLAYSSKFSVISKDNYLLDFAPDGWCMERQPGIDIRSRSLNDAPATGREAWIIYSVFRDKLIKDKIAQATTDLDSNQVSHQYIRDELHDIANLKHIDKRDFERAIVDQVFRNKPIKKQRKTDKFADIDLIESYRFILNNNKKLSQKKAVIIAVSVCYPNLNKNSREFSKKCNELKKKISRN